MSGLPRITRLAFVWGLVVCGTTVSTAVAQDAKQEPASRTAVTPRTPFTGSQSRYPASTAQRPGPFVVERFRRVQSGPRGLFGLPAPNRSSLNDQHVIVVSTLVLILGAVIIILLAT